MITTRAQNWLSVLRFVMGFLFIQHGLEKMWGFAGGRIDRDFSQVHAWAGPIEVVGGALLMLGLFTRTTAFIMCGEMAVAYFKSWAPHGFWPITNGGELAVLNCYVFLWLVFAGGGPLSLDALLARRKKLATETPLTEKLSSWEPQVRSIARIIIGFLIAQHGFRNAFGMLAARAGRRGAAPMALDLLGAIGGYVEMAGGILLMLGLLTVPVAIVLCLLSAIAYIVGPIALPANWPMRNGGEEAVIYCAASIFFALAGAGAWSVDALLRNGKGAKVETVEAT